VTAIALVSARGWPRKLVHLEFYTGKWLLDLMKTNVAIIGAGPAGLTAAYLLSKNEVSVTVLEADPVLRRRNFPHCHLQRFSFRHRRASLFLEVERGERSLDREPQDMLDRPRSSRIFYGGSFLAIPSAHSRPW